MLVGLLALLVIMAIPLALMYGLNWYLDREEAKLEKRRLAFRLRIEAARKEFNTPITPQPATKLQKEQNNA